MMPSEDKLPMITLVVATSQNRAIGKDNQLLWHLPEDLKHFKRITSGHAVIMGRKTFESIGKPLPNRRNIIVTRQADYQVAGAETASSLAQAFKLCENDKEVFILGGAEIYKQSLPHADRIYLTLVEAEMEADTFFPPINDQEWGQKVLGTFEQDERHPFAFRFLLLERRNS